MSKKYREALSSIQNKNFGLSQFAHADETAFNFYTPQNLTVEEKGTQNLLRTVCAEKQSRAATLVMTVDR